MPRWRTNLLATTAATLLMLIALGCSTVTVTDGEYASLLMIAMTCASLAVFCLAVSIEELIRGSIQDGIEMWWQHQGDECGFR